jgi:hypothetical protein
MEKLPWTKSRAEQLEVSRLPSRVPAIGSVKRPSPGPPQREYRKDHIRALACGGPDAVSNLQWQTITAARAKDRWEVRACGG